MGFKMRYLLIIYIIIGIMANNQPAPIDSTTGESQQEIPAYYMEVE